MASEDKGQQWFKLITGFVLTLLGTIQAIMFATGDGKMKKQAEQVIHSPKEEAADSAKTRRLALQVLRGDLPKEILKEGFKQYFENSEDKQNIDAAIEYFSQYGTEALLADIDTLNKKVAELKHKTKNSIEIIGDKKPEYITTTDGVKRKLYYGSPQLEPRTKFYYYRDGKDKPVPIYFISQNE